MNDSRVEQIAPFHFYLDIGNYAGTSAASYEDFLVSIRKVDVKSLSFHVKRGDFERWASDSLKDENLAKEIGKLKNSRLQGQALRNRLYSIVSKHHKELTSKTQ